MKNSKVSVVAHRYVVAHMICVHVLQTILLSLLTPFKISQYNTQVMFGGFHM